MGSLRRPKLSDSAICLLYGAGMSRYDICLRAGLVERELTETLKRNGVALRSDAEWRALAEKHRTAYRERRKARRAAC
jgi:hypothetical protein